jgi:cell division protein FtsB
MKKLRNLDFDKAETDFYDQLKSKGTQWAVDMSYKSISENAYFDENDWRDIGGYRIELVQKLQSENDDLREEKRKLNVEIRKLKEQLKDNEE